MKIGVIYHDKSTCEFIVWAPLLEDVKLKLLDPDEDLITMTKDSMGYWRATVEGVSPNARYMYKLDGDRERPDPASFFQPEGVHKASQVFDHSAFNWGDECWKGLDLSDMIIYELHVGTFTEEGTFQAIEDKLDYLVDTGINALEIMPVAQFPGERNWGYDGVYPFAPQNSYGGPQGFKSLVNRCHDKGIAVILDVVYNHLGPEGNYFWDYGPYFTSKYVTPWGEAINFDDPYSDGVRNYFLENALYWLREFHLDGLRLDAIHSIFDISAKHILEEISEKVRGLSKKLGRRFCLIAESDLNDSKVIRPRALGGLGLDAQWCDDFHHALHTLVTGEDMGYYKDYGSIGDLVKSFKKGFVYTGEYSPFRKRNFGHTPKGRTSEQFVVFSQNHDQIGNRMTGDRLSTLISFEALKLTAGTVLLSPFTPFLYMGEEYGENAPFLYFVSHSDSGLIESVREGRKAEFSSFKWKGKATDPQAVDSFVNSKLRWEKINSGNYKILRDFYKFLISLRKDIPALANPDFDTIEVYGYEDRGIVFLRRWCNGSHIFTILNFKKNDVTITVHLPELVRPETGGPNVGKVTWKRMMDSSDEKWGGKGSVLPDNLISGHDITIRGECMALYCLTKDKE